MHEVQSQDFVQAFSTFLTSSFGSLHFPSAWDYLLSGVEEPILSWDGVSGDTWDAMFVVWRSYLKTTVKLL